VVTGTRKTPVEAYQEKLTLALRLRDVTGARIGEVLAEVEAHTAETGEDPGEAFGPPKRYAAEIASIEGARVPRRRGPGDVLRPLGLAVLSGAATAALIDGTFSLAGFEEPAWGLPPLLLLAVGLVLAGLTTAWVSWTTYRREDPVRDPRTGRVDRLPRWVLPALFGSSYALVVLVCLAIAALT
jgi:hypothetical protein